MSSQKFEKCEDFEDLGESWGGWCRSIFLPFVDRTLPLDPQSGLRKSWLSWMSWQKCEKCEDFEDLGEVLGARL
jgi:hypothetical protein